VIGWVTKHRDQESVDDEWSIYIFILLTGRRREMDLLRHCLP